MHCYCYRYWHGNVKPQEPAEAKYYWQMVTIYLCLISFFAAIVVSAMFKIGD